MSFSGVKMLEMVTKYHPVYTRDHSYLTCFSRFPKMNNARIFSSIMLSSITSSQIQTLKKIVKILNTFVCKIINVQNTICALGDWLQAGGNHDFYCNKIQRASSIFLTFLLGILIFLGWMLSFKDLK